MTKDEFIDGYIARSNLVEIERTPDGFKWPDGHEWIALPCVCGEDGCDGWAMIENAPLSVLHHKFFSGPDEGRPDYEAELPAALAAMKGRNHD